MNHLRISLASLSPLALLLPAVVAAQQRAVLVDTLRVSAASRASGELAAETRGVEVITAEAIRRLPARTVADVLRWAFGVDLMPRSPALTDVALRGSSFEQVLVLVDGVRVSDAQTGHFDLNLAVPLDQVARIEVLRGPASTLHGADAVGGVINVVTRHRGRGLHASAQTGSHRTAALALSQALSAGVLRADLAGDYQRSDGHRPGTDYRVGQLRAAAEAPLGAQTLHADVAYAARDFGANGFYGSYDSYEETRTTTASLAWRGAPSARFALEPVLSLRRNGDDYILEREDPEYYHNQHATWQLGGALTGRYALSPLVRLAGGAEYYVDRLRSRTLGDRSERRAAVLAEVAAGEVGRATATVGLRADRYEGRGTFLSPSLAAAWWPAAALRLRASAGRAFRAPTWTERYYRDPANVGDPDLRPERAWTAEAGADAYPLPGVRVGAAAFVRDAEELIDWARPSGEPTAPWRTRNVQEARYRGLEVEAELQRLLGVRWVARGNWLSVHSTAVAGFTSKYALRPLVEQLSLSADRDFAAGFTLGVHALRARRVGEDAYLRVDARASYAWRAARLFLDVQNAGDADYPDITGLRAPGRGLYAGVEWRAWR
jgi:iron complex outermembrane receptor protein